MKKIFSISLAILALAACTRVEIEIPESNKAITFGNSFVAYATRAAEIQESNFAEFSVWGEMYSPTNEALFPLFEGNPVKKTGSAWASYSTTDPNTVVSKYWIPNVSYYFAAVAPIKSKVAGVGNIVTDFDLNIDRAAANQKYIGGSFDFTNTGEDDLIFSTYYKEEYKADTNDPDNDKVNFTFKHLLSKVRVSFANQVGSEIDLQVSNVKIQGQQSSTYNISTESWAIDANSATDNFSFKEYTNLPILTSSGTGSVGTTESLFVIPSNKYSITFSVTLSMVDVYGERKVLYTGDKTANITADDLLNITQKTSLEKGIAYNFIINVTPQKVVNDDSFEIDDIRQEDWNAFSLGSQMSIASKLGGIITLTAPVEIPNTIDVIDDLTINLNGRTITYTGTNAMFNVKNAATLTINDKANDNIANEDNGEEDNSRVVSNACIANASNGAIVINGGKYDVSSSSGILTKESTGSVRVNKGFFLEWNPASFGFIKADEYRSVKRKIDQKQYYQVDKIIPRVDVLPSTPAITNQEIIDALDNPFVDRLVIDNSCDIVNNGSLYVNHDIIIEGSTPDTDVPAGGGAAYGFRIHGDYKVEIKNLDIIGGGIYTTPEVDWDQGVIVGKVGPTVLVENCHFQTKYTSTSRQVIYVQSNGEVTLKNCDMTVTSEATKKTHYILTSGSARANIIKDTNVDYTPKNVVFTGGKYSDAGGFVGNVTIYGGTYDVDPAKWVPEGYTSTKSGSNWIVTKN